MEELILKRSKQRLELIKGEKVVGYAKFSREVNSIYIHQIYIEEESQGKGLGTRLVNELMSMYNVTLYGVCISVPAAKFWAKFDSKLKVFSDDDLSSWVDYDGHFSVLI